MREQQEALEKEKAQLEKELSEINDPENIEEQAREQLRLIKKGEYLYVFPEDMIDNEENPEEKADKEGIFVKSIEGRNGTGWVLMDYGDVIVNIFTQEKRDKYDLEKIWSDCEYIEWEA